MILQKGEIRVINQATCEHLLPQQITPRMICVGYLSGGVGACQVGAGAGTQGRGIARTWGLRRGWHGGRGVEVATRVGARRAKACSSCRATPGAPCPAPERMEADVSGRAW